MTQSFTFGELPPAPDQTILDEFATYEIAWLSDAMDLHLLDPAIRPVSETPRLAGPAVTVTCPPGDFLYVAKAMTVARPGDVLVIDARGDTFRAVWGEYFSSWARALGLAGVVIDGATRDASEIAELGFPVFSRGTTSRRPTLNGPGEVNVPVSCGGVCVIPGDVIVADGDGIISVPQRHLGKALEAVRVVAARERSHGDHADGGAQGYRAFYERSFAPRIAALGDKPG